MSPALAAGRPKGHDRGVGGSACTVYAGETSEAVVGVAWNEK